VNWGYWRDSARALEPNHPTIAPELGAELPAAQMAGIASRVNS
jgi:hypothetical protein